MNGQTNNDLEHNLRDALGDLAREAPNGLAPGRMSMALRRRAIRRFSGIAAALVMMVLSVTAAGAWLTRPDMAARDNRLAANNGDALDQKSPRGGDTNPILSPASPVPAETIKPLPRLASQEDVETYVGERLRAAGVKEGVVSKTPEEGVCFVLTGDVTAGIDRLNDEFSAVLSNYTDVTLRVENGRIGGYSLMVR